MIALKLIAEIWEHSGATQSYDDMSIHGIKQVENNQFELI